MRTHYEQSSSIRLMVSSGIFIHACLCGMASGEEYVVVPADEIHSAVTPARTRSAVAPTTEARAGFEMSANRSAAGSTRSLAAVEVRVEAHARISLPNIRFKINSASDLANEASRLQLGELAKALKMEPGANYLIEGHTCALGTDEANNLLSARRADFVRSELIKAGVQPSMVRALGCGEAEAHKNQVTPEAGETSLAPYRKVMIHKIAAE